MKNRMMSVAEASDLIGTGATLMIAGDERALASLPRGTWIGGTSVYFLTDEGGREDRDMVYVTQFDEARAAMTRHCPTEALPGLAKARYDNGATMILIPAFSEAHQRFALDGAGYEGLFDQPLMGWITGVHLDDIGKVTPKTFDGATGEAHEDGAMLLHVEMPEGQVATLDILNLFEQDAASPEITFTEDGFTAMTALVNGEEVNLAHWVAENEIDTQLPLVANYAGAMINVSFQAVDPEAGTTTFYAPVVHGVSYRLARDPGAYAEVFASKMTEGGEGELSCNCILNYLYGELEGKRTGGFTGPATFGEIAYILLNQTMVRLGSEAMEQQQVA